MPETHTSTQQWQSFEMRMRRRRVERCVLRATVAFEEGLTDLAREALEEAQALDPSDPEARELADRIAASTTLPPAAPAPRRRGYAAAAAALLIGSGVAGWLWVRTPPAVQERPIVVVNSTHVAPVHAEPGEPSAEAPDPPAAGAVESAPSPERAEPPQGTAEVGPEPEAPRSTSTSAAPPALPPARVVPNATDRAAAPRGTAADGPPPPAAGPPVPGSAAGRLAERGVSADPVEPVSRTEGPVPAIAAPVVPTEARGPAFTPSLPQDAAPPALAALANPVPTGTSGLTPAPPAAAGAAPAAGSAAAADERLVRAALARYQAAYSALDASAARAVWPSVDQRALERAFSGLASQSVNLGSCQIRLSGTSAQADCTGTARWTPRVGGGAQTAARRWRFELAKGSGDWTIQQASVQ